MLALSVSISTSSSPRLTSSPSDFSHLRIVPSSMESERRGIATSAMPGSVPLPGPLPSVCAGGRRGAARAGAPLPDLPRDGHHADHAGEAVAHRNRVDLEDGAVG